MHPSLIVYFATTFVVARTLWFVYQSVTSPLRDIPGPFVARFTRLWYLYQVYTAQFHAKNIALHKKYGPIVRLAPNLYSIDSPEKTVYGIASTFPKSDWYEGFKHPSPDKWSLFVDRDIKRHADTRRTFQSIYSMSSLVSYQTCVESCTEIFCERLNEFDKQGQSLDMGHWLQCYAFDVIGDITYSRRFGFLDDGKDKQGIMKALRGMLSYAACVGVYAWTHPVLYTVFEKLPDNFAAGRNFLMAFVAERIAERNKQRRERSTGDKKPDMEEGMARDFLDKITDAHEEDPQKVIPYHISMMNLSNIIAGSDTTAISLSSVIYHLLRHPRTMQKLRQEVEQFRKEGKCEQYKIKFAVSQQMPYLQAVIKEALRVHPATGLPMWRDVPAEGAQICGRSFPGGISVGLNTWVAHRNQDVFGKDADEFRPERWLEAEEEGGDRLKQMDVYWMPVSHQAAPRILSSAADNYQFGLGSRTCIGRHISILEMSKLIPVLVRNFDFTLERPNEDWTTENYWFVKPQNFEIKVKAR